MGRSPVVDGSERPDPTRVGVWMLAAATVVLCVVAASSGTIRLWEDPQRSSTPTVRAPVEQPQEDEAEQAVDGSIDWPDLAWLLDAVNVLALLLLVLAVALAISERGSWTWRLGRRIRRGPKPAPPPPPADIDLAPLDVDVDAAGEALAAGTPRNGIVRCWMQLEDAAGAVDLARLESETAAEYVERVVASSSVDPGPIAELAALYREARFSRHELDDTHRTQARRALDGVAAQLSARTREPA